jgi:hypothetical protein
VNAWERLEARSSNAAWKSVVSDQTIGASLSAKTRRNQARSTSAM